MFDEFPGEAVPGIAKEGVHLKSIHEHLPPQVRKDLKAVGWTKGLELPKGDFRWELEKELTGREEEPSELIYFKDNRSRSDCILSQRLKGNKL